MPCGSSPRLPRAHRLAQAGWEPYSRAAIEQYRAQGRPVFVDFTARWCLSCQVNERAVLNRGDVRRRLRDSGIVLVRADWTKHDEDIASALTELGRSGVPTYVFYLPGQPALTLARGAHTGRRLWGARPAPEPPQACNSPGLGSDAAT